MFRFRRFKASLNFNSGKPSEIEHFDKSPGISLNGAYRTNKDELFGSDLYPASPKKITPSMVKLPTQSGTSVNQSKSMNNLEKSLNEKIDTRKSAPDIPQAANQSTANLKEQMKLQKQRLTEQKKQQKLIEKEKQREEKLRREREKLISQQTKAVEKRPKKEGQRKPKKRAAPQPQQAETQNAAASNPKSNQRQQYSTNTLESTISKSSGPPPYSSVPELSPTRIDVTEHTSITKKAADMDPWRLISQHRQEMNRQAGVGKSAPKQKILDLQYNVGNTRSNENENSNA